MTDWATLDTPYGPRTGGGIPPLFAKLDDANARVRSRALQDLHRHLVLSVHGGWGRPFSEAALAAVPGLGARLTDPGALEAQLGQVCALLGDVAAGNHRWHLGTGVPVDRLDRPDLGPARATQAAVTALAPDIAALLEHDDGAVRAGAAFALAWLPGAANGSIPALLARLDREKHAATRATVLLSLGYLGGPVEGLRARREERAPVGLAAALAAMLVDPRGMDGDLDAALVTPSKPVVSGLPFGDGGILGLRREVLRVASVRRSDLTKHLALVARLPAVLEPEAAAWTVEVAAAAAGPRAEPLDPDDLPAQAREALRAGAARLGAEGFHALRDAFWRAGLFRDDEATRRALGLGPQGPLDARVEGRPLWWWLHGVRAGRVPEARWRALLSRADALAVLEDAASPAYELGRDRATLGHDDHGGLEALLARTAEALAVSSATLEERLARLRGYAERTPPRSRLLDAPWP